MQLHKKTKNKTRWEKLWGRTGIGFSECPVLMKEMFESGVVKWSQTINVSKRSESKSSKNTKAFVINPWTA